LAALHGFNDHETFDKKMILVFSYPTIVRKMVLGGCGPVGICVASVMQRIGHPSMPWPNDSAKEKALDSSSRA
jgi:hypothetical protein